MSVPIVATVQDRVGVIELALPDKFNCLSMTAWKLIDDTRQNFESNANVRVILVRAQGRNFCTGADLDEVQALRHDKEMTRAFIESGHKALLGLENSPLPVVAAVQGLCLAGGLELMMGADVVFAAKSARLGDQHAQYGLIPGWGNSQRLPRLIGLRRALELMYSARWLSADEAQAIGLINYVSDDEALADEAMAFAAQMAGRSRQGLAQMKRLARDGLKLAYEEAMQLEAKAATDHIMGGDTTEGLAAFSERRKPHFD